MLIAPFEVTLPFDVRVSVVALDAPRSTGQLVESVTYHLQRARRPEIPNPEAELYARKLPRLADQLAEAVKPHGPFAYGLCVPSSRNDARPYFDKMLEQGVVETDISACATRTEAFRSGPGTTAEEALAAIQISLPGFRSPPSELLIVDDMLASGRSVAAIVKHLQERGLPSTARVMVACALSLHTDHFRQ